MNKFLDWLHCLLHGHRPIAAYTFTRRKKNGGYQQFSRYECFVCRRRIR